MKWSGGKIVAKAIVDSFRQMENCTLEQLRDSTRGFGLYDLFTYWVSLVSLPPSFFGITIYLTNEQWLDTPFKPSARSYGPSWIVVDNPSLENQWLNATP